MRIQPITNNITTNYYNQTKANRTPQFKGKFNGDNPKNAKIRNFFEQYMSPGCNVGHSSRYNDEGKEEYYSHYYPFNVRWTPHIELDDIPDNCEYDLLKVYNLQV